MRLWRISNYSDLSGIGGLLSSGRWHSRGMEIVYLAESPSAALLERLVHLELDPDDVPSTYQLLAVEIPNGLTVQTVDLGDLPSDWQTNDAATRALGDRWLREMGSLLLRVPSAITPHTFNCLFNPKHPNSSKAKIVDAIRAPFDPRLLR